ncbi:MAG: hypothetical protein SFX19_06865 [Alphaproteobacteria bacterium]|nr:hypothetical protein [Alphaproteobacteria bacterium]
MDYFNDIPVRMFWPALVMSLVSPAAQAGAITNLTESGQVVEIQSSEGYDAHTIAPGRTLRVSGKVKIKFADREFYLDDEWEYAVWPDGAFGPQRKTTHHSFK